MPTTFTVTLFFTALTLAFILLRHIRRPPRPRKISPRNERVVILGGTSGVGRCVALEYARRGALICIVGRRAELLDDVLRECTALYRDFILAGTELEHEGRILAVLADFSNIDDMLRLRTVLELGWLGVDTIIVAAGVSAIQPLMILAGLQPPEKHDPWPLTTRKGIRGAMGMTSAAMHGNFLGPLLTLLTLIPFTLNTSPSPSIALVSSVAALIPAPTRAVYAATKAAALLLYQALAIEHPGISFTTVFPGTIQGDFRASAVDAALAPEQMHNGHGEGLRKEVVARRVIAAVDWQERVVWMPAWYRWAHVLYWVWPAFVERKARKKYGFSA